jgi:hypothetical protein
VLPLKLASPLYLAVIEWAPTDRLAVLAVHVKGAAAGNVQLPIVAVPSRNVTVPVGVPVPGGVTVAVKVTDWPKTDGLADDVSVVAVVAPPTL